ncbi:MULTISPECIES: cobyrinate a,c-diamide synthase [unclassified Yoonia]|uniref:cobyrinate a,c-diamide synthase n=1 Tax=unclassified Yoonia TaxID=2629118 RepID=UPI002AFE1F01|nr:MULTISPECIES: cobyrinate a,c-diamide synthase [unclassified Yoonia]
MRFLISAPASGSGKTTVTLGLLRAFSRTQSIRSAKSGPDYIDPAFHAAASGAACVNLDAWAMTPDRIRTLAAGTGPLIVEGAMGLFDGAPPAGKGSSADLAKILTLPVVLVIDAGRMAGSVGALAQGFMRYDPDLQVAGVILNNLGSPRHEAMLRNALQGVTIFGALPRDPALHLGSRHLGLVQAQERPDLEVFLDRAADLMTQHLDLTALQKLHTPRPRAGASPRIAPPAQRIAIARDAAFAFAYPHLLDDWRAGGAELHFFSPLADDPAPEADFIYLPGGYPELHAGRIAANARFMDSLRQSQATIYGECGGYMVLGDGLVDADGTRHAMAGLLRLETSFAQRKLHLGYRHLHAVQGPFAGHWTGHEFHYATTLRAEGTPLFTAGDATGAALPPMGLIAGRVSGSFAHLIDASAIASAETEA